MRPGIVGVMCLTLSAMQSMPTAAQSVDADDCQRAAKELKSKAARLEQEAESLGRQRNSRVSAEEVGSAAMSAVIAASDVAKDCGGGKYVTAQFMADAIKQSLLLTHSGSPQTRARIKEIEAEIQAIAAVHANWLPIDYRVTFAIAEAIFKLPPK